nr:thioredoxin [uncultured Megasphaera sp.]
MVYYIQASSKNAHTANCKIQRSDIMKSIIVTKDNFQTEVAFAKGTVLVDFWAAWCGPCQMLSPVVDEIAEEHPEIKICKVNVDEQPALAQQFNVELIPTLIVFQDGKVVRRNAGVLPKEEIIALLK